MGVRAPRKYGNKPVYWQGITFDSIKEFERWKELKNLIAMGVIKNLERQPKFKLTCGGRPVRYESGHQVTYKADFRYFDIRANQVVVEDAKGKDTRDSKLRRAVLAAELGIRVVIV